MRTAVTVAFTAALATSPLAFAALSSARSRVSPCDSCATAAAVAAAVVESAIESVSFEDYQLMLESRR